MLYPAVAETSATAYKGPLILEMQTHKRAAPLVFTVREVAAALRLDESTVCRMAADGRIQAVQLGPRCTVRVPRRELERLLTGNPRATASEAASGVPSTSPQKIGK